MYNQGNGNFILYFAGFIVFWALQFPWLLNDLFKFSVAFLALGLFFYLTQFITDTNAGVYQNECCLNAFKFLAAIKTVSLHQGCLLNK